MIAHVRARLWEVWYAEWNAILNKGVWYRNFVGDPFRKLWFKTIKFKNRKEVTTVIRLRTGHWISPVHLHRIGVAPSPLCACGSTADLEHIFNSCPNYSRARAALSQGFSFMGQQAPHTLKEIHTSRSIGRSTVSSV